MTHWVLLNKSTKYSVFIANLNGQVSDTEMYVIANKVYPNLLVVLNCATVIKLKQRPWRRKRNV